MLKTDLTIAICTFNRPKQLKNCLKSILQQEYSSKIIIIDNDYQKSALSVFKQFTKKLSLNYYCQPSKNISKARNLAICKCTTQFLAFIDDDCKLCSDWSQIALKLIKQTNLAFFQGNTAPLTNNKLISIQQNIYQKWLIQPYSIDTKNLILNLKLINKNKICFDPDLPIFEDVDLGLQIKQKQLKGKFIKNLVVEHQEISDLKKLTKKYYFRGKIKFYFNQKWGNYDHFSSRIFSPTKDFIKRKKSLFETILNTVFNIGFIIAKKQNFNPNSNTIFIINHLDRAANQERLEAVSKFLNDNNFTTKTIDSQKLFDQKINHFSGFFVSPVYFIYYRLIRLLIHKLHFSPLSSLLYYLKIVYRGKLVSQTLKKQHAKICLLQSPEDLTSCLNDQKTNYIYDLPTIISEELKEGRQINLHTYKKIKKLEHKIFQKNIPISFHWYSILNYAKKINLQSKRNFILNWGCYSQVKTSHYSPHPKIVHIGNINSPWVNQKLLKQIQTNNSIDIYSYEKPNTKNNIKTLGFLKDLSKLSQYQFGLITISKDKLRSNSFSAKHLTYISFGLPVFCPEWRQDPLLKSATIYYNENNFESQFKKYSQKKFWLKKHQAALKLAQKLNWNITLLPIISVIHQIQSQEKQ